MVLSNEFERARIQPADYPAPKDGDIEGVLSPKAHKDGGKDIVANGIRPGILHRFLKEQFVEEEV